MERLKERKSEGRKEVEEEKKSGGKESRRYDGNKEEGNKLERD